MLPAGILLAALTELGVYPFGELSLLVVDMDSEYIDYFVQMNKIAREHLSYLRSWDMGMGLSMLGLIAFYAASPLNVILLLFPVEYITEAVLLITLLKIGLCGLCFALYAQYAFRARGVVVLAFSVAWALIGYNVAYLSNIMWLDGVAFLPLVLLGAEKILREDQYALFALSLIYVFVSSYYIGYMVGVFTFLYFTAQYFTRSGNIREYLRKFGRFLLSAALAAGCCAVLLLPAFLNLRSGQDSLFTIPASISLDKPFVHIAAKLLPGVFDTLTDSGYPNIYLTTAGVLLFALFFLNKAVPLREKAIFGGLTVFLLLSFSCRLLDLAWHAFEDPTWFPARYSFVFSFLLLHIGLRCLERPEGTSPARVWGAAALVAALYLEVAVSRYRFVQTKQAVLAVFLLCAYAAIGLIVLYSADSRKRGLFLALALVLVCAEAHYSALGVLRGVDGQFHYRSREGYYDYRNTYLPAVELIEEQDEGVYRTEVLEQRNANGGMALGYHGISHYSTTTDQALNALLKKLGYNTGLINELHFARTTPLTNGLLGIRYVISKEEMGVGYTMNDAAGDALVYENSAAFPMAYFSGYEALRVNLEQADPFLLQNSIVSATTSARTPVFAPLAVLDESYTNIERADAAGAVVYTLTSRTQEGVVEYTVHNPRRQEAFAFFPVAGYQYARAEITVDGVPMGGDLAYRHNTVIPLGSEQEITVKLVLHSDKAMIRALYFYAMDLDAAQSAAADANSRALAFTRFEDTRVEGTLTAPEDGLLVTSFPYDEGWTVWVDGKKVTPKRYLGVFLAVHLRAGQRTVRMRYLPPGFLPGLLASVLCVAGLVLWLAARRRGLKPRKS